MAERVCPVWIGYWLASPIRKLWQSPEKLLAPYIRVGMTVVEVGPGMGFFTVPMGRLVGPWGKVVSIDVQQGMLDQLRKRAAKAGLADRIETRLCRPDSLGISDLVGKADFILLFAVVHEVANQENLFAELSAAGKKGCQLLFEEPKGHVPEEGFVASVAIAEKNGFTLNQRQKDPQRAVFIKQ